MESGSGLGPWACAGYVLRHDFTRPDYASPSLLPERLVSVSKCLAQGWPDSFCLPSWPLTPAERAEQAARAGMDAAHLVEVQRWSASHLEARTLLWPDVFDRLELAREFAQAFVTHQSGLTLLGLAVHSDDRERWTAEFDAACSRQWSTLGADGELLGWEPLSMDGAGPAHSWLCNYVERAVHERFGWTPNAHGLIEDVAQARRVAALCDSDDLPAEPEPWFAVGLVRFPLQPSRTSE